MKYLKKFKVFEATTPLSDLLKSDIGVIIHKSRGIFDKMTIILFDFKLNKIIGNIDIDKDSDSLNYYQIFRSAAEKGYGPTLYDICLMGVYPNGIRPSAVIKPGAQSVWKYYKNNRSDIEMEVIDEKNPEYVSSFETDLGSEKQREESTLDIINTIYFLKPTDEYNSLVSKGENLMNEYKVKIKDLMKLKEEFFKLKYY